MSEIHNPALSRQPCGTMYCLLWGYGKTKADEPRNISHSATLSRVLNGCAGISPEMALRLEKWLSVENSGRAELWIAQQASYDLWNARRAGSPKVERANTKHAASLKS